MVLPELFFLSDSIKAYLELQTLPLYAWDVFQFDLTRAFMIARFNRWQMLNAGSHARSQTESQSESTTQSISAKRRDDLNPNTRIEKLPYWDIIQTQHYLYNFVVSPIKNRNTARFRKGIYHYLILPFSHRHANVYKIPGSEVAVYDFEDRTTIADIIRKNEGNLPEDRILHIIRRMKSLGMIDILS